MVGCFRDGALLWEPGETKANTGVLRSAQDDNPKKYGWMAVPAFGLAAALVVGVMVPHWMHERSSSLQATAKQQVIQQGAPVPADDALMQQVQQQLDEDVPSSMAPLTALIQTDEPRADARKMMRQKKEN